MLNIPPEILNIIHTFHQSGYQCYVVGGFVRDALLGVETHDLDLCTDAHPGVISELLNDFKPHPLYPYGARLHVGAYHVEIMTMRTESVYVDGRHPEAVHYTHSLQKDVLRRDFTMNALYYAPNAGIIDLVGGQAAIANRRITMIGDPLKRLDEDYVRILRAYAFQSRYGFEFDEHLAHALLKMMPQIHLISPQNSLKYLESILMGPHFNAVARQHPQMMMALIPELEGALDYDQKNPENSLNLYDHSMQVVANLPFDLSLRIVGLFHDLGKMKVQVIGDDGVATYPSHALQSALLAKQYLDRFQFNQKKQRKILTLIENHDLSMQASLRFFQMVVYELGYDTVLDLIIFKKADNRAKALSVQEYGLRCDRYLALLEKVIGDHLPLSSYDLALSALELSTYGIPIEHTKQCLHYAFVAYLSGAVDDTKESLKTFCLEVYHELYSCAKS